MKRKPVLLTLLLTLLAVFVAAAVLLLGRRPPPVPPPAVPRPTPKQAAQAQRHIDAFIQQLQPDPAPPPAIAPSRLPAPLVRPQPRTLRLTEEDLNVTLAGNKAARKMLAARGVRAVQVVLSEPAHLTVRATVIVKGRAQNIQLDGTLAADPKTGLRYTATRAQVGRFPLPPAAVTAQADALAARLSGQMRGHLPLSIQTVRVQGKTLVLTGLLARCTSVRPPAPASPRSVSPARR